MINCANYWTQPLPQSTSDYFNTCGIDSLIFSNLLPLFQHANFGNGYAGIVTSTHEPNDITHNEWREYIQARLTEPLSPNKCYYCEFWVECSNWVHEVPYCALDALGIYFSDTLPQLIPSDSMNMFFTPQISNPTGRIISDTGNWTKISGFFTASGGEKYFTVGNFKPINEVNNIYFGSPAYARSYYFIDNFSLCPCEDTIPPKKPEPLIYIPNIFTPNNDGHNDIFYARGQQVESFHIMIYNRWGNKVFEYNDINQGWNGTCNGRECGEAVFYYVSDIVFTNGESTTKKGTVTLVR